MKAFELALKLEEFLVKNKLQVVCENHLQISHDDYATYSWSYYTTSDDVWEFGQNEKSDFPSKEELELGVGERLVAGETVTVVQHSDSSDIFIR